MRVSDNHSYLGQVNLRSAGPVPMRNSNLLKPLAGGDSVSSVSANAAVARQARVAELQQQYQEGKYKVNAREVSSKIIERHLEP